jgi:hypothetical protein
MILSTPQQLNIRLIVFCAAAVFAIFNLLVPLDVFAQPSLPNILPDAIDADDNDPVSLGVQIVKYVVAFVLWVAVLWAAVLVITEAIKDIKAAKDGDTKWISAGKSIVGGIFLFLTVLAIALWVTNWFLS